VEYRQLGNAGVRVSAVGLGGNTFGHACDVPQTAAVIHRAIDLGINHVDTADIYSNGRSEDHVGKALVGRRQDVVLATKVGIAMGDGPNNAGLSYRRVLASCEGSLKRLGTDYIDLYYLHRPDPRTPLAETLRALDDLVRAGKIRYVGLSNFPAWQMTEALWISDRRGFLPPAVTQSQFNILDRGLESEIVPFCKAFGVGIVPYSPLAGGLLTGKYRKGKEIQPGVRGYNNTGFARQLTDHNFAVVEGLEGFARDHGHTVGELAIAWLLANPSVCSVIAGATKPEQVEANAAAATWTLTADDLKAIDGILTG
jgi:aryl-alcohol dehydrogenase-like predicted oxidoreductase